VYLCQKSRKLADSIAKIARLTFFGPPCMCVCTQSCVYTLRLTVFSARQHVHVCYSALYAIARPSVRHTGGSFNDGEVKRQETRVIGLLCGEGCVILNSKGKIGSGAPNKRGMKNKPFSANKSP